MKKCSNPYLPNENRDYAYVCNICGEVMIAGQIVNFNTITDIRDTHEYQITHDIITRASDPNITDTNILKRTVDKRKFWAEGRYTAENRYVQIEFTAHKKVRSVGINMQPHTIFEFRILIVIPQDTDG